MKKRICKLLRRVVELEIPLYGTEDPQREAIRRLMRQRGYRVAQRMWHDTPVPQRHQLRKRLEDYVRASNVAASDAGDSEATPRGED